MIVLFKIFLMILTAKKVDYWSIFDEVIRRTKMCNFWATLYAKDLCRLRSSTGARNTQQWDGIMNARRYTSTTHLLHKMAIVFHIEIG